VLQQAFHATTVINLVEAPGFLKNKDDEASLIGTISPTQLEFHEQQVDGRMKRKMLAIRKLFEQGAAQVMISDGRGEHPIADALAGKGTVIA
jgi:acetylglutamate/LysW-gamma-L-alpha-aminoadipate kinase